MSYREKCKMYTEVGMGNPGKVPYCRMTGKLEPDCSKCERPDVTNADRIRAMSDEELAVLLERCICPKTPCTEIDRDTECGKKICYMCWLDWLKQEVRL